jgi:peptidyl-prolyl cis-trans isomerase SurA
MNTPRLLTLAGLFMSSLATSLTWADELLDRSIAIVNRTVITESELMNESRDIVRNLSTQGVKLPPAQELYKQVLEQMILKQAQEDLASQLGIRIRDEEVNERLQAIAQQNNLDLITLRQRLELQEPGSFMRLRDSVRDELSIEELRNQEVVQRIRVTPEEVKNFVNRKLSNKGNNTRYKVQHLLIALPESPTPEQISATREKAKMVWQNLKNGEDFAQLAIRYSADSKALSGGDLGWLETSELPGFLEETIVSLAEGNISEPVQSGLGFHIVKINGVEKTNTATIPSDFEQQAIRVLRQQKGNSLYEQWLRRVRDEAYVNILAPEYKRDTN